SPGTSDSNFTPSSTGVGSPPSMMLGTGLVGNRVSATAGAATSDTRSVRIQFRGKLRQERGVARGDERTCWSVIGRYPCEDDWRDAFGLPLHLPGSAPRGARSAPAGRSDVGRSSNDLAVAAPKVSSLARPSTEAPTSI